MADPERAARVAGIAVRHARLRHIERRDKKVALVLSAYPTKHSRIGNAVGLDTPASAVELLRTLIAGGYDFGPVAEIPGLVSGDGDELIRALIEAGGHDQDWLTEEQLARNPVRIPAADYKRWFAELPAELRSSVEEHWGEAPGNMFVDKSSNPEGDIVLAALRRGTSSSSSSRRAASARTRSRSTTTRTCRPRTTTWPRTAGSRRARRTAASAPTR